MVSEVVDQFHQLYLRHRPHMGSTPWMGAKVGKIPSDMLLYAQILYHHRPTVLVETGTWVGGSALYLAHLFDLIGEGRVISIDVRQPPEGMVDMRPVHPRITYIVRDSIEAASTLDLAGERVMVSLDSDHSKAHVAKELRAYAPLVSPGQYLVVEDTCINGHPVEPGWGEGPWEAVAEWEHPDFIDRHLESEHLFTFHTWLYRVR